LDIAQRDRHFAFVLAADIHGTGGSDACDRAVQAPYSEIPNRGIALRSVLFQAEWR
jgi:hypothetical protein